MNRFMIFAALAMFLTAVPAFAAEGEKVEKIGRHIIKRTGEALDEAGSLVKKHEEPLEKKLVKQVEKDKPVAAKTAKKWSKNSRADANAKKKEAKRRKRQGKR